MAIPTFSREDLLEFLAWKVKRKYKAERNGEFKASEKILNDKNFLEYIKAYAVIQGYWGTKKEEQQNVLFDAPYIIHDN